MSTQKRSYYTRTSLDKLKAELNLMKTKDRAAISKQIGEAMAQGDLKENAEYHAAKEAQRFLEIKIANLGQEIATARIIDENSIDTLTVSILNKVKIKNKKTGKTVTYKLTSNNEANIKEGKISSTSPIGKGLLGKKIGDIAIINVPIGQLTFEILDISI